MQGVTVLGATGSIGRNTLDVLARHPDRFRVVALTAHSRVDELAALCRQHRPAYAVVPTPSQAEQLRVGLSGMPTRVLVGAEALAEVASLPEVDAVMAAIVGAAGLLPTLAAVRAGKRILLANKEALVMSGELFMAAVRQHKATLLPIDSEHNAIYQCLPRGFQPGLAGSGVSQVLLTASGGPFRTTPTEQLARVSPAEAVRHPNWSMGRKISVDSATLMNKGLELIEACFLFGLTPERVKVVVHPESVIHSLVQYIDGSVLAQLGNPDMRTPIAFGLAWPERMAAGVEPLDLIQVARLQFEAPDEVRFPCLRLARAAMQAGGTAPAVLNAANEIAVMAFLEGRLGFTAIPALIEKTLARLPATRADSLEAVLAADEEARVVARAGLSERV